MRETITIQVGQCGNQIGNHFWSKLLEEHEHTPDDDPALSSFFRFIPDKSKSYGTIMKARALLIDMECGPLQETMRSTLGSLFEDTQFVMDVYGSGNNFAHGHYMYGPKYRQHFEEGLRKNAEHCDSLQTFLVTHSLSGGTGSGVGTYIINLLHELYPEVYRFSACVFPAEENDVVTSPYNSILATNVLIENADCVLPVDNYALQSFVKLEASQFQKQNQQSSDSNKLADKDERGFDEMNEVAARMLCHLTSSSRFHGVMNVDMNEICTNLVPYPKLHFLMTALSPHRAVSSVHSNTMKFGLSSSSSSSSKSNKAIPSSSKRVDEGTRVIIQRNFHDILSRHGQITAADPSMPGAITLASAFLARGNVGPLSDFLTCVTSSRKSLKFPFWNQDAFKIGVCNTAAPGHPTSVMGVYNSTSFATVLNREKSRFNKLFRRKAMLHHYTEFVDVSAIEEADEMCNAVIDEYQQIERNESLREQASEGNLDGHANRAATEKSTSAKQSKIRFPAF